MIFQMIEILVCQSGTRNIVIWNSAFQHVALNAQCCDCGAGEGVPAAAVGKDSQWSSLAPGLRICKRSPTGHIQCPSLGASSRGHSGLEGDVTGPSSRAPVRREDSVCGRARGAWSSSVGRGSRSSCDARQRITTPRYVLHHQADHSCVAESFRTCGRGSASVVRGVTPRVPTPDCQARWKNHHFQCWEHRGHKGWHH